jgi:hypothetical protein
MKTENNVSEFTLLREHDNLQEEKVRGNNKVGSITMRGFVVELTVWIEECVSKTLGIILDIDWEKSESFGNKSSALSLNQKIRIIQDMKGVDKEMRKKLETLMYIRNKFAHVKNVISFESLFSISKNEIKNNLFKLGSIENEGFEDVDEEAKSRKCFIRLCSGIQDNLIKISKQYAYNIGVNKGQIEAIEKMLYELCNEVRKQENGESIINKVLDKCEYEFNNINH